MDEAEKLIWQHGELSKQIDREFELLGQRTNWLLSGNAFLFTIVAICSQSKIPLSCNIIALVLIIGASLLGILVCYLSYRTMDVGRSVIYKRKESRGAVEECLKEFIGFQGVLTSRNDDHTSIVGNIIYKILPWTIAVFWVAVLVAVFLNWYRLVPYFVK